MKKKNHSLNDIKDLKELFNKTGEWYADRPAYKLRGKEKGTYKIITHKEFSDDINALGTALINMGLKGKRIAVISENRYEWGMAYLAVVNGTGVIVPLDKLLPENEIKNLIIRSEVEAIFYSKEYDETMKKLQIEGKTNIKYFISMDLEQKAENIYSQKELVHNGKELIENGNDEFLNAKIDENAMAIMLFTSGTTANSKAVMLSHKNIITNVKDIAWAFEVNDHDMILSFLPWHHVFECTVGFLHMLAKGACIVFCDGIRYIADNLKEYEISVMVSVPILFEAMYKKLLKEIEKQGKLETVKRAVKVSNALLKIGIDIRKILFKEIHQSLGGKARILVAGGAALDPETEKGFNELGLNLYQGYGLTEMSPVVSAENERKGTKKIGSIGKPFPSLEVKIEDPDKNGIGELMVKGPTIMLGYYNNEEETKKALEPDGWFHTGDLAKIDNDGFIFISGREKSVIVLQNGKNIFPEELEALISKIEGVKESMVYGKPDQRDGRKGDLKVCAKIVYDKNIIKQKYNTTDEAEIQEKLWQEVKTINKKIPSYKYIKEIIITEKELIKTTTQKVKRQEELKTLVK